MITRIEIDGFKSFMDFSLDVPPFLALVGPNSSGKSNLFDALEYVKQDVIGAESAFLGARRGRPQELFHRVLKGRPVGEFSIQIENIQQMTFGLLGIRHLAGLELENGLYRDGESPAAQVPIKLTPIDYPNNDYYLLGEDLPDSWSEYRSAIDRGYEFIALDFRSYADESLFGGETVRDWRFLTPEPSRMRSRWPTADDGALGESGKNIAAVLGRLAGTEHFDDIIIDLAALIPGVTGVTVDLDEHRQEWSFDVVIDDEGSVPSTLLSDGTLRVLAVLTMLHDPKSAGTLLIEEIETGLHPSRLKELIRRIRQRVSSTYDPDEPLRQVIVTSHSPVVVSDLYATAPDSLMFMDTVARVDPENERVSRVTRALPVRSSGEPGTYISPREVRQYLGTVRGDER